MAENVDNPLIELWKMEFYNPDSANFAEVWEDHPFSAMSYEDALKWLAVMYLNYAPDFHYRIRNLGTGEIIDGAIFG